MNFLQRQLENPVRLARIKRWFYAGLVVVALGEAVVALGGIFLPHVFSGADPHFGFEGVPAWGSLYGFVSCVAIIVVSKFLGKVWLMRREDYYDS